MSNQHDWVRVDDGTAYYCAVCRMRVDDDEFAPGVEDSLCVPFVPEVAEHVEKLPVTLPYALATDPTRDFAEYIGHEPELEPTGSSPVTLVEFAAYMGWTLTAFQATMLAQLDRQIQQQQGARGIPN